MNAELLAMLGGASAVPSRREAEPKTLVSFKAGKMNAESQPDGRYLVTADPRRGTIEVNWTPSSSSSNSSAGTLKIEWKDRRTRAVVDSHTIMPEDDCTYSKIDTNSGNDKDRVYLLQYGNSSERRFFFWMQDKEEGNLDEDYCVKINTFMADPAEAVAAANGEESPSDSAAASSGADGESGGASSNKKASKSGSGSGSRSSSSARIEGGLDNAALMQIMQGINTNNGGDGNSNNDSSNNQGGGQIDTLSDILENLGMPQQSSTASSATTTAAATAVTASTPATENATSTPEAPDAPKSSGGLTLSDLQGAMAGLATTSPPSQQLQQQSGPPLSEIATPAAVTKSGILENEEVKSKLIALLPEGQRTEDKLMENLRSPQVKQCLKSLTAALEEVGSFNSILANFQLKPEDGAAAMISGNPIQAFLDCVLKSVEREKVEKSKDNDGDSEMKE